tara:strand:- start:4327 stop:4872 length:546 start_codon:yes stop_codon:yes gene_type:complete
MIRINLYPDQRRKELQAHFVLLKQSLVAVGSIMGVIILCVIMSGIKGGELNAAELEKAQKQVRLEELKNKIGVADSFEKKKQTLEKKRQSIVLLRENQEDSVVIMDHISRSMVQAKVWLTSLSITGKNARLSGWALTNEDIVRFQTTLQSTPSFSSANLIVSRKQDSIGQPLYQFDLGLER